MEATSDWLIELLEKNKELEAQKRALRNKLMYEHANYAQDPLISYTLNTLSLGGAGPGVMPFYGQAVPPPMYQSAYAPPPDNTAALKVEIESLKRMIESLKTSPPPVADQALSDQQLMDLLKAPTAPAEPKTSDVDFDAVLEKMKKTKEDECAALLTKLGQEKDALIQKLQNDLASRTGSGPEVDSLKRQVDELKSLNQQLVQNVSEKSTVVSAPAVINAAVQAAGAIAAAAPPQAAAAADKLVNDVKVIQQDVNTLNQVAAVPPTVVVAIPDANIVPMEVDEVGGGVVVLDDGEEVRATDRKNEQTILSPDERAKRVETRNRRVANENRKGAWSAKDSVDQIMNRQIDYAFAGSKNPEEGVNFPAKFSARVVELRRAYLRLRVEIAGDALVAQFAKDVEDLAKYILYDQVSSFLVDRFAQMQDSSDYNRTQIIGAISSNEPTSSLHVNNFNMPQLEQIVRGYNDTAVNFWADKRDVILAAINTNGDQDITTMLNQLFCPISLEIRECRAAKQTYQYAKTFNYFGRDQPTIMDTRLRPR